MSEVSELSPPPGSPGPSTRKRADSVISLSSELTDPEALDEDKNKSTTSNALTEDDEEEPNEDDDDIVEVNKDGSATAATRIRELLNHPPKEPKHRWETAYVYAFIERFTSIQQDSAYAPQTILEFETALQSGGGPVIPSDTEQEWVPSLDPILKDFAERCKRGEKEAGGTGGISGKWQVWVPWWVEAQRNLGAEDFRHSSWREAIKNMRDKDDDNKFYSIPWDKKLMVLKALVDFQVCVCPEVVKFINSSYHYETASEIKEKAEQKRKQKQQEKEKQAANASTETKQEEDKKDDKPDAKDKGKGKETDKPKVKAAPKEKVKAEDNPLLIVPIGKDLKKRLWYRIDESPRLYINSKPDSKDQNFVAISDTSADLESILKSLKSAPVEVNGKSAKPKAASDPFSKAKAVAAESSSKGKTNGKEKSSKTSKQQLNEANEHKLHAYITKIVLPAVTNDEEDSPYENKLKTIQQRRHRLIKKREKEIRDEAAAAARAADVNDGNTYGGTRSSRRLRRGNQDGNGYNESAKDDELEQAIRASERDRRKRKRDAGEDDSGSSDEDDTRPYYGGMDLNNDDDEEDFELDPEDESQGNQRNRRSTRAATSKATTNNSKPVIPGERRSTRVRNTRRGESTESSDAEVDSKASTSRRRRPIIRDESDDDDDDIEMQEEAPFNGLEEVWSKGRYTGYLTLDKKFIPAKRGDIPLYKLAKMGLPLPSLYSTDELPANTSAESSVPGSAVPTLEMENGDTSEGSISRDQHEIDQEEEDEGEDNDNDNDNDSDAVMVVSSRSNAKSKKRVDSESPPAVEVTSTRSPQQANKKPRISDTSHIEVVIP